MQRNRRGQWLIVLFVAGCLIFGFPLMALFDRPELVAGIPLAVLYLFGAWFGVIGLTWLIHEWRN
jgi:hypothetical protein